MVSRDSDLRTRDGLELAIVLEPGQPAEVGAQAVAEQLRQLGVRASAPSWSRRSTPRASQPLDASWARCPGTSPGEAPPKRSRASAAVSERKPSGLSASEATFATSLLGPIPIEHARPVRSVTAALIRLPAALGRSKPVRSR